MLRKARLTLAILMCFVFAPCFLVGGLLYSILGFLDSTIVAEETALISALGGASQGQTIARSTFEQIVEFVSYWTVRHGLAVFLLGGLQLVSGIMLFRRKSTLIAGALLVITAFVWTGVAVHGYAVNPWHNYVVLPETLRLAFTVAQIIVAAGIFCFAIVVLRVDR